MRTSQSIELFLVFVLCTFNAFAGNLYVRPDGGSYGTEDGADWNNAFNGFGDVAWGSGAGQAGAGDTLFVSGGTYTSHLIPTSDGNASGWLVIRRATDAVHGNDAGWESAWDSLAHLYGAYIDLRGRSYIELDGVTEYGMKISGLNDTMGIVKYIWIGAYVDRDYSEYLTIRNMELVGPGKLTCDGTCGIGVYSNYRRVDHLVISRVRAHEFSGAAFRLGEHDNVLVENCRIYNVQNASYSACDGNNPHNTHLAMYGSIQNDNVVIRNNYFYQDYDDDRVNGGYALGFGYVSGDVDIYNNVFYNLDNPALTAENPMPTVPGAQINFFNNTIVGFRTIVWAEGGTFNMVNNIYCNEGFDRTYTRFPYGPSKAVQDSNNLFYETGYLDWYDNGSNIILADGDGPFDDYDNPDPALKFRLHAGSPAKDTGKDLSDIFNYDIEGNPREPGAWDVGALEYQDNVGLHSSPESNWPAFRPAIAGPEKYTAGRLFYSLAGIQLKHRPLRPGIYLYADYGANKPVPVLVMP